MEVITAKSYFKNHLLLPVIFLGIGICILVVNDLIGSIDIDTESIFRSFQIVFDKIFRFIGLICAFWLGIMQIFIVCVDFFDDRIKYYNKICTSQWRKNLLNLGFTEILGSDTTLHKDGVATLQHFTLRGIYEDMPLQIKSAGQYYHIIEISIPLNLEIDKDFEDYKSDFSKKYNPQNENNEGVFSTQYNFENIGISQEKIFKTIKIAYAVEDKIIWATVHELQNIANEVEYKDQKLVNYLKFEKL